MNNDDAAQNTKSQRVDPVLSKPLTSCTTLATDVILDFGLIPKVQKHDDVIGVGVTYKLPLRYSVHLFIIPAEINSASILFQHLVLAYSHYYQNPSEQTSSKCQSSDPAILLPRPQYKLHP